MIEKRKKEKPLGKRVQSLLDQLNRGQTIIKQLPRDPTEKVHFFYHPSSKIVPPKTFEKALGLGLVKPSGDGLFGDDTSQTWISA